MTKDKHGVQSERSSTVESPDTDRPDASRRKALGKLVYAAPAVAAIAVSAKVDAQSFPDFPCNEPGDPDPIPLLDTCTS